ncbi:hypothetical protein NODU109028_07585 [Nocardioides dubius]
MVLPRHTGLTGWAALRWCGATWFDGLDVSGAELEVQLLTADHSIRSQPGIRVSEERRSFATLRVLDGVPCVDAVHATAFAMRYAASAREAGVVFEMAAFSDAVSIAEIRALLARMNGWTGVPRAREALAHLDENSWSPQETRLRQVWLLDALLPKVLANRPVFDRYGNHLGTPDLFDEEAGLVVEYDGAHHLQRAQRLRDLDREARFRRAGLEYLAVASLRQDDRGSLIRLLREARSRARFAAPSSRAWTTALPRWWTPLFTVEQRRSLDAEQRERWLRTRRAAA